MSLVLGWTDGITACIASDGRAGGDFPSENYDKTRKINENIILGFVGMKSQSEHFLNCTYEELGDEIKHCYIEEFMDVVKYGMSLKVTREKLQSSFLIIGKTKSGDMKYIVTGQNTNFSIKYLDPKQSRIYPIGGTVSREKILLRCSFYASEFNGNVKQTLSDIIVRVSNIDSSINKNVFFKEILYAPSIILM